MARELGFDHYDAYDAGGEYRPLTRDDLAELIGRMAAGEGGFGDPGGEFVERPRPFRPPDVGGVALRPPGAEPILELTR